MGQRITDYSTSGVSSPKQQNWRMNSKEALDLVDEIVRAYRRSESIARCFDTTPNKGYGLLTLSALGQLTPDQIEVHLTSRLGRNQAKVLADKIQVLAWRTFVGQVGREIRQLLGSTRQRLDELISNKDAREQFLANLKKGPRELQALVALGIHKNEAAEILSNPRQNDLVLRNALLRSRKALGHIELDTRDALLDEDMALGLLSDFSPIADKTVDMLGVSRSSFLFKAVEGVKARGENIKSGRRVFRVIAGVVGAVLLGIVSAGMGPLGAALVSGAGAAPTATMDVLVADERARKLNLAGRTKMVAPKVIFGANDSETRAKWEGAVNLLLAVAIGGVGEVPRVTTAFRSLTKSKLAKVVVPGLVEAVAAETIVSTKKLR
ncbi:MAG: hypothetical protein V1754_14495 [Pseudomonadota bacterium]